MQQDYEMFKIVVIGSMGTGKTNITTRFIKNQFNEFSKNTVGVQFISKVVQVHNQNVKVTLWDTAGQERYKSLSKVYYKGASGILIVYDITDPQSYLDVQSWMRLANQNLNLNQVVLIVVGNKSDMEDRRKVPKERAISEYKDKFDIDCWEVSAKTGHNIKEVFSELIEKIYEMNMKIKGSHMPIDDSVIYQGTITQSRIQSGKKESKKQAAPSQLPIVVEEYDPIVPKNNMKVQPKTPTIKQSTKDNKTKVDPKKQIPKKQAPIKLDSKKNNNKKADEDCSC